MDLENIGIDKILSVYLQDIKAEYRDAVLGAVMKSKIIERAFSSPEGKMILEGAVNSVTKNIDKIIGLCRSPAVINEVEQIADLATKIGMTLEMLEEWASIYAPGKEVIETGKKKLKKQ